MKLLLNINSAPTLMEKPCEDTKGPCEWSSDEEYDENGDMVSWDSYCGNCYRNRDWSKDEYKNLTANDEGFIILV